MRHLVIGASGQLGGTLRQTLAAAGEAVTGTGWQHADAAAGLAPLDVTDPMALAAALDRFEPEVVWLPAALTDVDYCERYPEASAALNFQAPVHLARLADRHGFRFIFFSTDYVFDGRDGPYDEEALPRPLQVYGEHKRRAETAVLEAAPAALVVRTAWLYGSEAKPRNFVYRIVEQARRGEIVRAATDQVNTPTAVWALAETVRTWAATGIAGIRHAGGDWLGSRFELTHAILELAGHGAATIMPVTLAALQLPARRPLRTGLVSRWGAGVGHFARDLPRAVAAVTGGQA